MKINPLKFIGGFKGLLLVLAVGIGLSLHLYTRHIIHQLRNEARSLVEFYAQMYAKVAETPSDEDLSFLFDQIIRRTNFPIIQTDTQNNPVGWKGIDVNPDDRSEETIRRVRRMVEHMDQEIDPVPVKYGDTILNYLHYGDSGLIQQLRWLPSIEVGIIGLFILVGFIGYANIKRSEQRYIWVGMAKETAHQLGTPLSSLMGWLEVIRSKKRTDIKRISMDMEKDLRRLHQVTNRFSQIGSKPDLKETDVAHVLREVAEYIRRRAPQMGRSVVIREVYEDVPSVGLNAGLFQWAVENVLKNALDAMDKQKGCIEIRLGSEGSRKCIYVDIQDNGKGIEPAIKKRIFKPGYSTKKRGWGLGLTLAKRIVEEYHGGKLFVKESRPKLGTTVRIELS
jgi:two-component sensor histidine kinase